MKASSADWVEFCRGGEDVVHDKAAEEEIELECRSGSLAIHDLAL